MNRYQNKALSLCGVPCDKFGMVYSKKHGVVTADLSISEEGTLQIKDDRDYFSREYTMYLRVGEIFDAEVRIDGKWSKLVSGSFQDPKGQSFTGVVLDFTLDHRPDCLRLSLSNGIIDPIEFKLEYNLITKEEYEEIQNSPEVLRKKMDVTYRTGATLINIFWKLAKEGAVEKVKVALFARNKNEIRLMANFMLPNDIFYKSIDGLAPGDYAFEVIQLDKQGREIVSSGQVLFSISVSSPNHRNVVTPSWL